MYKLYQYKPIKYGFVIICPNANFEHLKGTLNSINAYYSNSKITIVIPDKSEEFPKALKGGTTLFDMMNKGLKEAECAEWNFVICSEGWMKGRLDIKYSYFIQSKKDILFPIIKTKSMNYDFTENSSNGMLLHKSAFTEVGEFSDRLMWANTALEKGYKFKGVVGGRFF